MMHLFCITEDGVDFPWSIGVWAPTPRPAVTLAEEQYEGEERLECFDTGTAGAHETTLYALHGASAPTLGLAYGEVRIEERPAVLRVAGWRGADEYECSVCGYAPMGLPEFAIDEETDTCLMCLGIATEPEGDTHGEADDS